MPQEEPSGPKLEAQPAVLRATIQIIRAGTGKVENYEIIGTPLPPDSPQPDQKEPE